MSVNLFESELRVMELLWQKSPQSAKELAEQLNGLYGWSKTTSYTVIKKCVDKGAAARSESGYLCRPLISREEAQNFQADELIQRMYDGNADQLVVALARRKRISRESLEKIRELLEGQD